MVRYATIGMVPVLTNEMGQISSRLKKSVTARERATRMKEVYPVAWDRWAKMMVAAYQRNEEPCVEQEVLLDLWFDDSVPDVSVAMAIILTT